MIDLRASSSDWSVWMVRSRPCGPTAPIGSSTFQLPAPAATSRKRVDLVGRQCEHRHSVRAVERVPTCASPPAFWFAFLRCSIMRTRPADDPMPAIPAPTFRRSGAIPTGSTGSGTCSCAFSLQDFGDPVRRHVAAPCVTSEAVIVTRSQTRRHALE